MKILSQQDLNGRTPMDLIAYQNMKSPIKLLNCVMDVLSAKEVFVLLKIKDQHSDTLSS